MIRRKALSGTWAAVLLLVVIPLLSGCGEAMRLQRTTDASLKYDYAKKYYNKGKYAKASELLLDVVPAYDGTEEGSRALFLFAESERMQKSYETSSEAYRRYYTSYPSGAKAEEAHFRCGEALYSASPEARLDQTLTYNAIQELTRFIELYPESTFRKQTEEMLFALQDKLAYKELLSARLYYNLGMYMGNNYRSAIITADNALKDYPYNKHREEFYILLLRAAYKEAINSVDSKLQSRYREVIDRYFVYVNEFPEGRYKKEAERIHKQITGYLDTKQ